MVVMISLFNNKIYCSYYAPPGKSGKRRAGRLSSIQQLQLVQVLADCTILYCNVICFTVLYCTVQVLADYFTGEHDFNLLCSVFMIVFMVQVTLTNTHQLHTFGTKFGNNWISRHFTIYSINVEFVESKY